MISIQKLRKQRGGKPILNGVDAEIGPGEAVAIVGTSGGGKTTLLRCLNGFETFDEGAIDVEGHALRPGPTPPRRLAALRLAVGTVFQELNLFPHLTVLENVTLAPTVVRKLELARAQERALDLLSQVGLGDRGSAYPHELSGGQKQRVAVVRALAADPKVLLLDEPTSALDPETAAGVVESIKQLTRGRVTVLLVTHHRELGERLADRVLTLDAGRLV